MSPKTRGRPYGDDGRPIVARTGRPPKPGLTPAEEAAIIGLGDQQAAAKVSDMRGANLGSISQAEAGRRRVSHDWLRRERLRKSQPTQNSIKHRATVPTQNEFSVSHTGPRASENRPAFLNGQVTEETMTAPKQVESERKEATV